VIGVDVAVSASLQQLLDRRVVSRDAGILATLSPPRAWRPAEIGAVEAAHHGYLVDTRLLRSKQ